MANKPNVKVLKKSEKQFDIELPKGDVTAAADALYEYFVETFGDENLVACQVCRMEGPEYDEDHNLIPSCPFCGTLFDTSDAVEEDTGSEDNDEEDDDSGEEDLGEEDPKPATKGKKKSAKNKSTPAKKRGRPKKESAELVPMTPEQEDELNESIERINELRLSLAKNSWHIGKELQKISDGRLWETAFGCSSFFEFATTKLDISRSGAYKYMLVAREFEEAEFLSIGIKKAELIAKAGDKHRDSLVEMVQGGATHTDLRREVNKLEGKYSGNNGSSLTLTGRVKEGLIEAPWLSDSSNKAIKRANIKNKHIPLQLDDKHLIIIRENEDGLGLNVRFHKVDVNK